MKVLAHISDLHFGAEISEIAQALRTSIDEASPDLLVISGDLTQRGRRGQFRRARAFLYQFAVPILAVPGNHDIPLYDVPRRFLRPVHRYRRYISKELNPYYQDDELAVLGINTARSLTWKNGRISLHQMHLVRDKFCAASPGSFKILVTHHPLMPRPGRKTEAVVGRAARTFMLIAGCNPDMALAGHRHASYFAETSKIYTAQMGSTLAVQAGTAISRRIREEQNSFNLIRIVQQTVEVSVMTWNGERFTEHRREQFHRKDGIWVEE